MYNNKKTQTPHFNSNTFRKIHPQRPIRAYKPNRKNISRTHQPIHPPRTTSPTYPRRRHDQNKRHIPRSGSGAWPNTRRSLASTRRDVTARGRVARRVWKARENIATEAFARSYFGSRTDFEHGMDGSVGRGPAVALWILGLSVRRDDELLIRFSDMVDGGVRFGDDSGNL